jgi:hypothetical protein
MPKEKQYKKPPLKKGNVKTQLKIEKNEDERKVERTTEEVESEKVSIEVKSSIEKEEEKKEIPKESPEQKKAEGFETDLTEKAGDFLMIKLENLKRYLKGSMEDTGDSAQNKKGIEVALQNFNLIDEKWKLILFVQHYLKDYWRKAANEEEAKENQTIVGGYIFDRSKMANDQRILKTNCIQQLLLKGDIDQKKADEIMQAVLPQCVEEKIYDYFELFCTVVHDLSTN